MAGRPEPQAATQRIFVALWPDAAVRRALGELARRCEAQVGGTRVPDRNLHLTLGFLGALDDAGLARLRDALSGVPEGVSMVLDRLGFLPRPRIVTAAAASVPPGLAAAHAGVRDAMRAAGVPPERRPFRPHVTLLRRARRPARLELAPIGWEAAAPVIVRSVLAPSGAAYEVLG